MATPSEIIDGLDLLMDSGLDFAPKNTDRLADAWVRVFADVPGKVFTQAVLDYVKLETKWPAPAKLRDLAEKVKAGNVQSVAGGQFAPLVEPSIIWQPSHIPLVKFSAEAEAKIAALEAKYYDGGLPTDAELAEIDAVTREGQG